MWSVSCRNSTPEPKKPFNFSSTMFRPKSPIAIRRAMWYAYVNKLDYRGIPRTNNCHLTWWALEFKKATIGCACIRRRATNHGLGLPLFFVVSSSVINRKWQGGSNNPCITCSTHYSSLTWVELCRKNPRKPFAIAIFKSACLARGTCVIRALLLRIWTMTPIMAIEALYSFNQKRLM